MNITKKPRVAVGLSGGVDSSVAAALLKRQGYDVIGITMAVYAGSARPIHKGMKHACYGPDEQEDLDRAESICKRLDIPFYVIDLKGEFQNYVIAYFRKEYLKGRTPNPCVVCNRELKFGFLWEKAKKAGIDFDYFATGHYARVVQSNNRYLLKRPIDLLKDQTYFLYSLTQKQLSRTFFPIGEYRKKQIREIALLLDLESADHPESQDFISGNDYTPLFHSGEIKEGDITDERGQIIGRHKGIVHYTMGQRRGLGIASDQPLYVSKIDAENNRIIVSRKEKLFSKSLIASDLNLISVNAMDRSYNVQVKIRLNHKAAQAIVSPYSANKAKVIFDEPQLAITPGQSAVFYLDDIVLGGGIIEEILD
ncbi:MAG: tRNA 2-thiouridine(34) synthase MnmA [Deltaproteobacteria bacterium]|nr:tRNA 2-thiouridine(34) synthase MnmA [Deltaproteobacteria bacterium]